MARRKRSEEFYNEKAKQTNEVSKNRFAHSRKENKPIGRRKNSRKRRVFPLFKIFPIILGAIFLVFVIYQVYIGNPEVTMRKALKSISESNFTEQDKYFDRIDEINKVLRDSYSDNSDEAKEFLKANYANLDIKIKSKSKTNKGLEVDLEVTNVNYIDVFDKVAKKKPENLHREYINALETEGQDKSESTVKVLMVRKINGYKIFESRDFVNAILGGALKYADKTDVE